MKTATTDTILNELIQETEVVKTSLKLASLMM
jgi:hypothetical protein